MYFNTLFWRQKVYSIIMYTCIQFVILTLTAMVVFPGGYDFLAYFFSELGMYTTRFGDTNPVGFALFFIALSSAGAGLILYFVANLQFFRKGRGQRILAGAALLAGVVSGSSFIGVAFTPADLFPGPHTQFVLAAFRYFFVATLFLTAAILSNPDYPNRYGGISLVFSVLLAAYIWLLTNGPPPATPDGRLIQATGQKIIVYAAIITTLILSMGAKKLTTGETAGTS